MNTTFGESFVVQAAAGFLTAARFAESDEDGVSFDHKSKYAGFTFTGPAVEAARERVRDFLSDPAAAKAVRTLDLNADDFGADLYFSGARHGTGFWDHGDGALGSLLHERAKPFGGCTITVESTEGKTFSWT